MSHLLQKKEGGMRTTGKTVRGIFVGVCLVGVCAGASASPLIDSAIVKERIWNDAPYSTFTYTNLYPGLIQMRDENLDQTGWANRHNFRLSEDGGISEAVFMNGDAFAFSADVTINGTANIEGGLNLSPWWSKDVDGVFMLKTDVGFEEVSCWGGRLPFYSFTANHVDPNTGQGLVYQKGTTVRLTMIYSPNSLTEQDPGRIQYIYKLYDPDGAGPLVGFTIKSPHLKFDEGNPAEPYGLWGILDDARVGGFFMPKVDSGTPGNWGEISFENMSYVPEPAAMWLLGLGLVVALRRR
jgi:hypothetical protein